MKTFIETFQFIFGVDAGIINLVFQSAQKYNDTCAWTPNNIAIGSWARYPEVPVGTQGTQAATGDPELQAISSWARYLGLGTLA